MLLPHLDAAFAKPTHTSIGSFWHGHVPFAHFAVARLRPRLIVEFGVEHGNSLFVFADALKWNKVAAGQVIGCDTWQGDIHVGKQADWIFERVSHIAGSHETNIELRRTTTQECAPTFEDETVDLLHIDASHDYHSVRDDYESMVPKLAEGGIMLFHDIAAFAPEFGVWKLWDELRRQHPHLCFSHSAGLGVLAPKGVPASLSDLFQLDIHHKVTLANLFSILGKGIMDDFTPRAQQRELDRIAHLPVPAQVEEDPLFSKCLSICRW